MTTAGFNVFLVQLYTEAAVLCKLKGKEYCKNPNDRFEQFDSSYREASALARELKCLDYLDKHLKTIFAFVLDPNRKSGTEPIRQRIIDSINYLGMLAAMLQDDKILSKVVPDKQPYNGIEPSLVVFDEVNKVTRKKTKRS